MTWAKDLNICNIVYEKKDWLMTVEKRSLWFKLYDECLYEELFDVGYNVI